MSLGIGALVARLTVVIGKRNQTITDLRAQLATSQASQVDPADVSAAASFDALVTAEEANNP